MAYFLQAIIADQDLLNKSRFNGDFIVSLPQNIAMLPFVESLKEKYSFPYFPIMGIDKIEIPQPIMQACSDLSEHGKAAFIEAEFHGGDGTLACVVWKHGTLLIEPTLSQGAINMALRVLGVEKGPFHDEFEALGLDRCRDTEQWKNLKADNIRT